jgi:ABC-type uncharacterized transport system involved in gliding motility auxiliary subunit
MGRLLDVTKLAPNFTEIPANTDVLAIIHPGALTRRAALRDRSIHSAPMAARSWRFRSCLDAGGDERDGYDPFNPSLPAPTASTLEPLLGAWGVTMAPTVVLDLEGALPVSVQDPATGQIGPSAATALLPSPGRASRPRRPDDGVAASRH